MTDLQDLLRWPALGGLEALPETLEIERAVWGKVHGEASDYRWIASSPALRSQLPGREREIQLGSEDRPRRLCLWRHLESDWYWAISCYPSRAVDAAGRASFLEKQVLAWKRPAGVPAALGALLLLPRVAALDDSIWWKERNNPSWAEEDFIQRIPAPAPVQVDAADLLAALDRCLRLVPETFEAERLARFYAALLAGLRPSGIAPAAPSSADTLAALLLPLDPEQANRTSLAGGLPSKRWDAKKLGRLWHGILLDEDPGKDTASLGDEQRAHGERMAQALLRHDPAGLTAPPTEAGDGPPSDALELALWGPASAGKTVLLAQLFLLSDAIDPEARDWDIHPTRDSMPFIQDMRSSCNGENRFPKATTVGHSEEIVYRLRHRQSDRKILLAVEDRAGKESQELTDQMKRRLREADGLILLFDPQRDAGDLEKDVRNTLDQLSVDANGDRDPRPVAVCLTKTDLLLEDAGDLTSAIEDPHEFARSHLPVSLQRAFDRVFQRYRFFPVSAVGVRSLWGSLEPVVFLDEQLEPRLIQKGEPLNLQKPFTWVLEQAGGTE